MCLHGVTGLGMSCRGRGSMLGGPCGLGWGGAIGLGMRCGGGGVGEVSLALEGLQV